MLVCAEFGNKEAVETDLIGCDIPGGPIGGDDRVISKNKLNVAPNPASGLLTVTLPLNNKITRLTVVDASGNTVLNQTVKSKSITTINLAKLKPGVYFIKSDDPNVESTRFVKH